MESDKLILKEVYFVTLCFTSANRQRKIEWYASFVGVMDWNKESVEQKSYVRFAYAVYKVAYLPISPPPPLKKKAAANLQQKVASDQADLACFQFNNTKLILTPKTEGNTTSSKLKIYPRFFMIFGLKNRHSMACFVQTKRLRYKLNKWTDSG